MVSIDAGLTIFILSSILGLGALVYFNNHRDKTNKSFAMLTLWMAIWMASNFLENELIGGKWNQLFLRIDFASASLLIYFCLNFCLNFPWTNKIKSRVKKILLFIPAGVFTILSFSDLIVYNINFSDGVISFDFGKIYQLYFIYILSYLILGSCGTLVLRYKKAQGLQKTQILYVLLGISLAGAIAVTVNLFLQSSLPAELFRIGTHGIIFFVIFTAFAIVRKELFDIKIALTALFVVAINALLVVDAFIFTIQPPLRLFKIIILITSFLFSYFLIKSVSREVKYKEELQKAYEELKKLDKAKSEFISMASHQLRTPLSAIKGYISMISEGFYGEIPPKAKKKLDNVFESNERLIKIVNELLNISKIELGKTKLDKKPTQLEEILESCCREMEPDAKKKKIKLIWKKPARKLPKIQADAFKLRQVFMNLVDNSLKYTQKGKVEIKAEKNNSNVLISFKDSGEGLEKQEQENIFGSFTRGKAGTAHWIEGTGFGLYLARKYVEMHGGKIWAESEGKGKGSTFFVELPISPPDKKIQQ